MWCTRRSCTASCKGWWVGKGRPMTGASTCFGWWLPGTLCSSFGGASRACTVLLRGMLCASAVVASTKSTGSFTRKQIHQKCSLLVSASFNLDLRQYALHRQFSRCQLSSFSDTKMPYKPTCATKSTLWKYYLTVRAVEDIEKLKMFELGLKVALWKFCWFAPMSLKFANITNEALFYPCWWICSLSGFINSCALRRICMFTLYQIILWPPKLHPLFWNHTHPCYRDTCTKDLRCMFGVPP